MLKEDKSYASPIASIFYEYYNDKENLKDRLKNDQEKIQCIVASGWLSNEIPFGKTQEPQLTDFADGINTLEFINNL